MKKRIIITVIMIISLLLTGCGKTDFDLTRIGDNTTIKVNNTTEGKSTDTDYFSVGRNEHVAIECSLDKGSLTMEFIEVTVFINLDGGPDDVIENKSVKTITVTGTDTTTVDLDRGDYIIRITAVGNTNGTVKVNVGK